MRLQTLIDALREHDDKNAQVVVFVPAREAPTTAPNMSGDYQFDIDRFGPIHPGPGSAFGVWLRADPPSTEPASVTDGN